jgi:glycosyltransferase involved in cell wall biosynthesis
VSRGRSAIRADLARRHDRPPAPGEVRLSVVLPAYREDRIGDSVHRVRAALEPVVGAEQLEIVVVDDGSGDGTADLARAAGADLVVEFPANRGKGAAVRAGMLAAHGRTVAFTDADLSYDPPQIVRLLEGVEDGWDIVTGNRQHPDTTTITDVSPLRSLGSRGINAATRLVLGGGHTDTQCGLKAFRSDIGRFVFGHTTIDGFAFDVEVFLLAERNDLALTEVPVEVVNSDVSTVSVTRDALRLLRDLFRIRRAAARGAYTPTASEQAELDRRAE